MGVLGGGSWLSSLRRRKRLNNKMIPAIITAAAIASGIIKPQSALATASVNEPSAPSGWVVPVPGLSVPVTGVFDTKPSGFAASVVVDGLEVLLELEELDESEVVGHSL